MFLTNVRLILFHFFPPVRFVGLIRVSFSPLTQLASEIASNVPWIGTRVRHRRRFG